MNKGLINLLAIAFGFSPSYRDAINIPTFSNPAVINGNKGNKKGRFGKVKLPCPDYFNQKITDPRFMSQGQKLKAVLNEVL